MEINKAYLTKIVVMIERMVKFGTNKHLLTFQISIIIGIISYFYWASLGLTVSNYLIIAIIGIVFFGINFAGIFAAIKDAKNIKQKFLTGLVGNIILNVLFLAALFYVVLGMN